MKDGKLCIPWKEVNVIVEDRLTENVRYTDPDTFNGEYLQTIYSISLDRQILKLFAHEIILKALDTPDISFSPEKDQFIKYVDELLLNNPSLIIFLFRVLNGLKGITSTREAISRLEVFANMQSIQEWKNQPDVISFVSDDGALSDSNCFMTLYGSDVFGYNLIRDAVEQVRISNGRNHTLFDQLLQSENKEQLIAMCLLIVLEHITLRNKLKCERNAHLLEWYKQNENKFSIPGTQSQLILRFLIENNFPGFENINEQTPMRRILQFRCLIHIIVVVLWKRDKMGLFAHCLFSPNQLMNSLFPTMNDDIAFGLERVLGGKIYECPMGHKFVVTECGKPMQRYQCNECGAVIGGENHVLIGTNREYQTSVDHTPTNYCCRTVAEEVGPGAIYSQNRDMTPMEFRFIRFIMEGLLFTSGSCLGNNTKVVLNPQYCNPTDVNYYFHEHMVNEWDIFVKLTEKNDEDLSIVLHNAIHQIFTQADLQPIQGKINNKEERQRMENDLCQRTLQSCFKSERLLETISTCVQQQHRSVQDRNKARDNSMTKEVLMIDLVDDATNRRKLQSMFMKIDNPTVEHFSNIVKQRNNSTILLNFVNDMITIQTTRYLPHIFKLFSLVCKRFDKRIRRENAQSCTIEQAIQEIENLEERQLWMDSFQGFSIAWNSVFSNIKRYGCLEIMEHMKSIKMSPKQPLSYIIPNEKDESIFSLALIEYLEDAHNNFIQSVNNEYLSTDIADIVTVTSRELNETHTTSLSLQQDLLPFLKDHCNRPLQFTDMDKNLEYDFEFIQQYLVDNFFFGKPLIRTQIKMLEFSGELRASGAKERFTNLKNGKITNQDRLTPQQQETILLELGGPGGRSDRCIKCFRMIEMAIHFIQSMLSSSSSLSHTFLNKPLVDYLQNDLMVKDARKLFGSGLSQLILIKHLDSVWELLEKHLTLDIFANVHPNYTEPITEQQEQLLYKIAKLIDTKLFLPTLQEAISGYLTEPHTDKNFDLVDWLFYLNVPEQVSGIGQHAVEVTSLGDLDWFCHLPHKTFKLSQSLSVYKYLESLEKE